MPINECGYASICQVRPVCMYRCALSVHKKGACAHVTSYANSFWRTKRPRLTWSSSYSSLLMCSPPWYLSSWPRWATHVTCCIYTFSLDWLKSVSLFPNLVPKLTCTPVSPAHARALPRYISLSCAHTLTCAHARVHTRNHKHPLARSLTYPRTHSLAYSHTISFTNSFTYQHIRLSLSPSLPHSLSFSHFLSLSACRFPSFSVSLILSLSLSLSFLSLSFPLFLFSSYLVVVLVYPPHPPSPSLFLSLSLGLSLSYSVSLQYTRHRKRTQKCFGRDTLEQALTTWHCSPHYKTLQAFGRVSL